MKRTTPNRATTTRAPTRTPRPASYSWQPRSKGPVDGLCGRIRARQPGTSRRRRRARRPAVRSEQRGLVDDGSAVERELKVVRARSSSSGVSNVRQIGQRRAELRPHPDHLVTTIREPPDRPEDGRAALGDDRVGDVRECSSPSKVLEVLVLRRQHGDRRADAVDAVGDGGIALASWALNVASDASALSTQPLSRVQRRHRERQIVDDLLDLLLVPAKDWFELVTIVSAGRGRPR